ncbi:uncharacterized protein TRIADDRAFT_20071, partial [Trichoplax adhaerens]
DFKMVIAVRTDLHMRKGKMAAQCCHGAIANYVGCMRKNPEMIHKWKRSGQAKVVVKASDEATLLKMQSQARKLGLEANVIADAGRTQIAAGSLTVLAVGPGPQELIDLVTGELKLM